MYVRRLKPKFGSKQKPKNALETRPRTQLVTARGPNISVRRTSLTTSFQRCSPSNRHLRRKAQSHQVGEYLRVKLQTAEDRRLLVNRASERLIMDQANDMVWTEEELDRLALYKIRAREKARAEGREQGRIETALDMLADNKPIEEIVKYSHLSMEKVLELRDSQATFTAK